MVPTIFITSVIGNASMCGARRQMRMTSKEVPARGVRTLVQEKQNYPELGFLHYAKRTIIAPTARA